MSDLPRRCAVPFIAPDHDVIRAVRLLDEHWRERHTGRSVVGPW